jgi:ketosteroid isomerase-like protein
MSIIEIANRLIELNKSHSYEEVYKELYSPELVSAEPSDTSDTAAKGFAGVAAKGEWWASTHEMHGVTITGPWPHGNRFIVGFEMDVTNKESGQRFTMNEMALYTVENGKIVREEFFYAM